MAIIGGITLLLLGCAGLGAAYFFSSGRAVDRRLLVRAEAALNVNAPEFALRYAEQHLAETPDDPSALVLAGRAALALRDIPRALEFFKRVPDTAGAAAVSARIATGEIWLLHDAHLSRAESELRAALQLDADNRIAHERLAYLLGLESRLWEQIPHRLFALRAQPPGSLVLFGLALGDAVVENPESVVRLHQHAPDDPGNQLALTRVLLELRRFTDAETVLRKLLATNPDLAEAQVRLGRVLLERQDGSALDAWNAALPEAALEHPGIWLVRGLAAESGGDLRGACRAFHESLRRNPFQREVAYRLGQALVRLGMAERAAPFQERAVQLEGYVRAAELAHHTGDARQTLRAAQLAHSLQLRWEAWGWAVLAAQSPVADPETRAWLAARQAEWERQRATAPLVRGPTPTSDPLPPLDDRDFPLPPRLALRSANPSPATPVSPAASLPSASAAVRFRDLGASARLDFRYRNGGTPSTGLLRMYEIVGGGAAVLDYDADGRPDLYFVQAGDGSPEVSQPQHVDRLYRNLTGSRFDDVTAPAGLNETGFGQGVGAGDWNNDGFPDLFIANIGQNRLLRNNGDGTFTDVTEPAGIDDDAYSVCGMIADLNGDTLPDLLAVNYLGGDDVFTRVCGDQQSGPSSCLPQFFPGTPSQFLLNQGDGTFRDVSAETGIAAVPGRGLGVLAWDLDGTGRPAVLIANDVGPNTLFVNHAERGELPRFVDEGLLRGVAANRFGRHESSMGIAAGDADGNGLLDVFVTNFDDETNTLYRQQPGGLFVDDTEVAGLAAKRFPFVGWGTQFLDAELDGDLDLLVSNGHVNNLSRQGKPYRMPAQFFANQGARFTEIPGDQLGDYFRRPLLGRCLVRLDVDRDGLPDAAVTHLDAPPSLLRNESPRAGNFLALELRGHALDRDALGTRVEVVSGGQTRTQVLSAGDGNQGTNQRQLLFGLGPATQIDTLRVHWTDGQTSTYGPLPADSHWLIRQPAAGSSAPPPVRLFRE